MSGGIARFRDNTGATQYGQFLSANNRDEFYVDSTIGLKILKFSDVDTTLTDSGFPDGTASPKLSAGDVFPISLENQLIYLKFITYDSTHGNLVVKIVYPDFRGVNIGAIHWTNPVLNELNQAQQNREYKQEILNQFKELNSFKTDSLVVDFKDESGRHQSGIIKSADVLPYFLIVRVGLPFGPNKTKEVLVEPKNIISVTGKDTRR